MIVVSHDRYFINRLATRIIRLHHDGADSYNGNYDFYLENMLERNVEELEAGSYIIRYKTVSTSRFDSTAFKKHYTDLYKAFLKQSTSHRFTISC